MYKIRSFSECGASSWLPLSPVRTRIPLSSTAMDSLPLVNMSEKLDAELIIKLRGEDLLDEDRVKPGAGWGGIIHCRKEFISLSVFRFCELFCIVLCVQDIHKVIILVEEE